MNFVKVPLFFSVIISFGYTTYHFLKDGYLYENTPCKLLGLFCNIKVGLIGLDEVLNWYGEHDILILLLTMLAIVTAVSLKKQ